MTTTFYTTLIIIISILFTGCENNEKSQIFSGKLVGKSACKSGLKSFLAEDIADTLSCIYYSYDSDAKTLTVKHINAGFNCCPDSVYCTVSSQMDTIIIREVEKTPSCNCNCLYDIEIKITGVEAKKYRIKIDEPYALDQGKISFDADLPKDAEGSFCVTRKQYPWGMNAVAGPANEKISLSEARELITNWIFNVYNPDMNPSAVFWVEEITTEDVWNKLHGQVFAILPDAPGVGGKAIFIKNKNIYDLGRRNLMGASKPDTILVSDLDADGRWEMCFLLKHGSGIIRTDVVCYINGLSDTYLFADTSFMFNTSLKLEKENNQKIILKEIKNDVPKMIGNLNLINENGTKKLKIEKYILK